MPSTSGSEIQVLSTSAISRWGNFRIFQFASAIHAFFYKQHFYKQRQIEIGKKSSKCWATPWGWNSAIWKLLSFHPRYYLKIIGYLLKNKQKNKCVFIHEIIGLIKIKWRWKWEIDHIDPT